MGKDFESGETSIADPWVVSYDGYCDNPAASLK